MGKQLAESEKVYLADSLITVNRLMNDLETDYFVEERLITKDENEHLKFEIQKLGMRIESRLDGEI